MAEIFMEKISKNYGPVPVLENLNLKISEGEFVSLVGPSGCGKTTILRLISGLEAVSDGEITIGTQVVTNLSPRYRDVAMVFQNYALYPHMSVEDNLGFALKRKIGDKKQIKKEVNTIAEMLQISDLLYRKPKELSGGQRQRVAMGRAIIRKPKVFLFDEPLSNLDAKLRATMRVEIKKLHKLTKITTLYVTHDQTEAMTLSDRIVIMNKGKIEQEGSPYELYNKPNSKFVGSFIGTPAMNFLKVRVVKKNKNISLETDTAKIQVPNKFTEKLSKYDRSFISLGIRPDKLVIKKEKADLRANQVLTEPLGHQTIVLLNFEDTEIQVIASEKDDLLSNQSLNLGINFNDVHMFDPVSGKSI